MNEDETAPEIEVEPEAPVPVHVEPPALPAPAPVNTVEHWALRAGYLPEVTRGARNPRWGMFRAAKFLHNWPEGAELTEAQFAEAIEFAATGVSHG